MVCERHLLKWPVDTSQHAHAAAALVADFGPERVTQDRELLARCRLADPLMPSPVRLVGEDRRELDDAMADLESDNHLVEELSRLVSERICALPAARQLRAAYLFREEAGKILDGSRDFFVIINFGGPSINDVRAWIG
jgi:hypothetical protein